MRDAGTRAWLGMAMALWGMGCMQATIEPEVTRTYGGGTDPFVQGPGGTSSPDPAMEDIAVREGRLAGQIGDVAVPEDQDPMLRAYQDWGNSVVEVHTQGAVGAAMFAAYVFPSLDSIDLPVGTRVLVAEDMSTEYSVLTVGCAGPVAGNWEYDEQPQRLVMAVTDFDQDGARELGFEATFGAEQTESGNEETVLARFELSAE